MMNFYKETKLKGNFGTMLTPEGIQAFATDVTGVQVYKNRKSQLPEFYGTTGYGASYVAKVASGTPRMKEYTLAVELKNGGEAVISFTSDEAPTNMLAKALYYKTIAALPTSFKNHIKKHTKALHITEAQVEHGILEP